MSGPAERTPQILVAGVGNAWMRDDGFGGEVARLVGEHELPDGVHVMDVSRQGGAAGARYLTEADEDDVNGTIEDLRHA